ncbi:hypothetical protein ACVW1C_001886 [Bradyrhizobium sp. USDA 4011]
MSSRHFFNISPESCERTVLHFCRDPGPSAGEPVEALLSYVRELARRLAREDHVSAASKHESEQSVTDDLLNELSDSKS